MNWIQSLKKSISYIEQNITEDLSVDEIARQVFLSPFYFQKGFAMLCGYTVSEYIRCRKLSLAGRDMICTNEKIIDIAFKYGYESADSFTKAFTRFHGSTPSAVRKQKAGVKNFAPLKIKFTLEGGYIMEYKIVEKEAFTVIGVQKNFKYETAKQEVPKLWQDFYKTENSRYVSGMYGINIDETMECDTFDYLIADNYNPVIDVPKSLTTRIIPKHTWAVFPCKGSMPAKLQQINQKIFSEWLPNSDTYKIAEGICVEMYSDPREFPKGVQDENYYCEMWIPVIKK